MTYVDTDVSISSDGVPSYVLSLPLYAGASGYPRLQEAYQKAFFYFRQSVPEIMFLTFLLLSAVCLGLVVLYESRKGSSTGLHKRAENSRPTLALGGTGLRFGYEFGCIAALQDTVNLRDVCVTTVSGSIFAGFLVAAPQLDAGKMIKALLNVRDHVMSPGSKGCYFMDVDQTVDLILEELHGTGGLTDSILRSIASSDQLRIGITSFCPWPTTRCVHCPDNFEDLHRVMAAAICIPPFFNRFARFEGHFAADAAFSSWFAIPDGCRFEEVVKLTPFFVPWARYRSVFASTPHDLCECVYPFGLDRQLESFREGYARTKEQLADPTRWQSDLAMKRHPIDMMEERIASIRHVVESS
ncbi:hypothetical protein FOZ63_028147 [Perkinsus olseni]|uniref:PNPLA domain-containing protein n=1 Tax=Perkinsus olseni TaxID=32597 RepID=A0A7J6S365_PEROL|nr:hypothetical protein FOZ63_028147 [Perkinsus olseni]